MYLILVLALLAAEQAAARWVEGWVSGQAPAKVRRSTVLSGSWRGIC